MSEYQNRVKRPTVGSFGNIAFITIHLRDLTVSVVPKLVFGGFVQQELPAWCLGVLYVQYLDLKFFE